MIAEFYLYGKYFFKESEKKIWFIEKDWNWMFLGWLTLRLWILIPMCTLLENTITCPMQMSLHKELKSARKAFREWPLIGSEKENRSFIGIQKCLCYLHKLNQLQNNRVTLLTKTPPNSREWRTNFRTTWEWVFKLDIFGIL